MAQAGSVQREPSMEEILASIRRIIEDSDNGQGQAAAVDSRQSSEDDSGDVEHFRAELKPSLDEAAARTPDLRLAETDPEPEAEELQTQPPVAADDGEEAANDISAQSSSSVLDWPVNDWKATAEHQDEETDVSSGGLGVVAPYMRDAGGETATEDRKSAMISEHAERKIAAAFEELNEAFEASRRQSLDEVAEEMLRPMLQDWLDNNLPMLVERLVREEIERVARGAAR